MKVKEEVSIRQANAYDAPEILRLAYKMWEEMGLTPTKGDWEQETISFLQHSESNDHRALVVDNPTSSGLIACGIAVIYKLTPAFWLINGKMGYIQWFFTEPPWRGRGIATRIANELLEWLRSNDVTRVQLHSAPGSAGIYEKLGFEHEGEFRNMWLRVDSGEESGRGCEV